VVADSDEHDEEGHITEDLVLRGKMVEKRLKKGEGISREVIPPDLTGEAEADLLLVSWGSSGGAAAEAAAGLRKEGRRASTLHFSQVWPLVPEQFLGTLRAAGRVIGVEGNATGQLARLIRRESGFEIREKVLRYDGLPLTPEYILGKVGSKG
jgi:2-oxoglutarate ferredoxin oxidoreductase subunit alpha